MRVKKRPGPIVGQEGFSMVEMLMTAFILMVGLLGLCMLQTMAMRSTRGSTSMTTAVKVAEGVMDGVEAQGRIGWLNISDSNASGAVPAAAVTYIAIPVGGSLGPSYFDVHGVSLGAAATAGFYQVTVTHVNELGAGAVGGGFLGDFNVAVTFSDSATGLGVAIPRTVSITRRIAHG